jgi:hypothetical protein
MRRESRPEARIFVHDDNVTDRLLENEKQTCTIKGLPQLLKFLGKLFFGTQRCCLSIGMSFFCPYYYINRSCDRYEQPKLIFFVMSPAFALFF